MSVSFIVHRRAGEVASTPPPPPEPPFWLAVLFTLCLGAIACDVAWAYFSTRGT